MTLDTGNNYRLRWADAEGADQEVELPQGQLVAGRADTCQIVLSDLSVSREHANITVERAMVTINDLNSRNGTFVNGELVTGVVPLSAGDEIGIGSLTLRLEAPVRLDETALFAATLIATEVAEQLDATLVSQQSVESIVPDHILDQAIISESELEAAGIEVVVKEFAALGGGLGSLAWVDFLRNSGVSADDIIILGNEEKPHSRYERLCINSQIPPHERLRSHSESCPDNLWGFPGYAVRESWRDLKRGHLKSVVSNLWNIFGEPAVSQTYTPRTEDVFSSIDKEAARIGWRQMLRIGRIRAVRKSREGRLLAIVSQSDEQGRKHFVVSARVLHIAIGYPAIQLLPDLAAYRVEYGDSGIVVNAYEDHDHVYEHLRREGGTVLIRGRGIVASRIIQRIYEVRQQNPNVTLIHLHRSQLTKGHNFGLSKRAVEAQFEFQPFNWPKACWGGETRGMLERASDDNRKELLDIWGGTTTADRSDWNKIIRDGMREGWYRPEFGVVTGVRPGENGRVVSVINSILAGSGTLELETDFIIDCTGAVASPDRSPFLSDLIRIYSLPLNKLGRVKVSNDFEVEGMRHGDSRLFASGVTTLGGPYAPVDSFLGLQYAALKAVDSAKRLRPNLKGLRRLNGLYSLWMWTKWARGVSP